MEGIFVPITFFFSTAAVLIVFLTTRHRERAAMVEKGLSPEDIRAIYGQKGTKRDPLSSLKWGILFVFTGAAVMVGGILHTVYDFDERGVIVGMVALFIGAGLLLFYRIASKRSNA